MAAAGPSSPERGADRGYRGLQLLLGELTRVEEELTVPDPPDQRRVPRAQRSRRELCPGDGGGEAVYRWQLPQTLLPLCVSYL
ncbi:MAG: hypothetical protein QOI45_2266 [Thermoleophilaceae bacterium]|jgi:hypothetical protein|nr:hypothetical protein [Thermoleophilaceae bacterium]MEA2456004.1 hypothetical protein [Thermoleophilaceae bacterium]